MLNLKTFFCHRFEQPDCNTDKRTPKWNISNIPSGFPEIRVKQEAWWIRYSIGLNFGGLTLNFHRRFRKNGIWTPNRRNARPLNRGTWRQDLYTHDALGIVRHSRNRRDRQQYLHIIGGFLSMSIFICKTVVFLHHERNLVASWRGTWPRSMDWFRWDYGINYVTILRES